MNPKTIILSSLCFIAILSTSSGQQDFQLNDVKVLNYALSLENLESTYYIQGLNIFNTSDQFVAEGFPASAFAMLQMIKMHEITHASTLTSAVQARGGTPVRPCQYNFVYPNVTYFLKVAAMLEDTGTWAYDGAINALSELYLQTTAATIATVEGRHAAYLREITGSDPFPMAFDLALTPDVVNATASQFIVSCNTPLTSLPQPANFSANQLIGLTALNASINDLNVLKFALFLEDFEYTFYTYGLARFAQSDFDAAGFPGSVREMITEIQAHEAAHVAILSAAVGANFSCVYNFNDTALASVANFIQYGALFENTGVSAYDGAIDAITDLGYRTLAATIATVEARHASYFNLINMTSPFPNAFDPALMPSSVLSAVSAFICGNCMGNLTDLMNNLPVPALFSQAAQAGPFVPPATSGSAPVGSATTGSAPIGSATTGSSVPSNILTSVATTGRNTNSATKSAVSFGFVSLLISLLFF